MLRARVSIRLSLSGEPVLAQAAKAAIFSACEGRIIARKGGGYLVESIVDIILNNKMSL